MTVSIPSERCGRNQSNYAWPPTPRAQYCFGFHGTLSLPVIVRDQCSVWFVRTVHAAIIAMNTRAIVAFAHRDNRDDMCMAGTDGREVRLCRLGSGCLPGWV